MRKGVYLVVRTSFHWQFFLLIHVAINFFQIFTENNPVRGLRKKYNIPEVNWLKMNRYSTVTYCFSLEYWLHVLYMYDHSRKEAKYKYMYVCCLLLTNMYL